MIYIEGISNDPYINLASEQFVFDKLPKDEAYFMLWQNANSVIIGKHQLLKAEVNERFILSRGIRVARRLSGGGAVYHDLGNLNFTFICDHEKNATFDFATYCAHIVTALSKIGVTAVSGGRNDITIDGKKFSGNAQYIKNNRIMHHGTLMFDTDFDVLQNALMAPTTKLAEKGVPSVRSRVTNIVEHAPSYTLNDFKKVLIETVMGTDFKTHTFTEGELAEINALSKSQYATDAWNAGEYPIYNLFAERRFPECGKISVYIDEKDGIIANIYIFGDFFGTGDIENVLKGVRLNEKDILNALDNVSFNDCFHNLSKSDFAELLTSVVS